LRRLLFLNGIKAFEAAARSGSFAAAGHELNVSAAAISRMVHLLEDRLGVALFERKANRLLLTSAGRAYQNGLTPIFDALASLTAQVTAPPSVRVLTIGVGPTFAMRWLIPRLSDFQRDHPGLELRIVTASTPAEQFRMDVEAVISGPARQPGWVGRRFLGEARLPVLSPELMRKCPLRHPADLKRHTLLHSATLAEAWPRWLVAAGVPDLKPRHEQPFEHFYFAIQAAIEGLGVVMGPLALVADELRDGRLLAPFDEPALRARGYFLYARTADSDGPQITALRDWLVAAGSQAEARLPRYLTSRRS